MSLCVRVVQVMLIFEQVIIGGYYGTGRHGGQISGFLLGLAVKPNPGVDRPSHYKSFCKCVTCDTNPLNPCPTELRGKPLKTIAILTASHYSYL